MMHGPKNVKLWLLTVYEKYEKKRLLYLCRCRRISVFYFDASNLDYALSITKEMYELHAPSCIVQLLPMFCTSLIILTADTISLEDIPLMAIYCHRQP